ncbi:hypothetical protein MNEG_12141, partial [Monoraphidium neglectum]
REGVSLAALAGGSAGGGGAPQPPEQQNPLEKFLSGLSSMGADALQALSSAAAGAAAAAAAAAARACGRPEGLVLTVKVAGVHWWYNSTSHASELTAGYYNTTSRDGYTPLLEMCARHGANVTLTCVEMCDAQHPRHAQCGPEGLLRQIRANAAGLGVCLSGENALRIFLVGGGIDATALDRIVDNTRSWTLPPGGGRGGGTGGGGFGNGNGGGGEGGAGCGYNGYGGAGAYGSLRPCSSWPCAPMREQQLVQQQQVYPGQYASAGGAASEAAAQQEWYGGAGGYAAGGGNGYGGAAGGVSAHRAYSEVGYVVYNGQGEAVQAGPGYCPQQQPPSRGPSPAPLPPQPQASSAQWWPQPPPSPQLPQRPAGGGWRLPQPWRQQGGSGAASQQGSGGVVLPAMRAFTFLRLGPEILDHQGPWHQFMYKMQRGRS